MPQFRRAVTDFADLIEKRYKNGLTGSAMIPPNLLNQLEETILAESDYLDIVKNDGRNRTRVKKAEDRAVSERRRLHEQIDKHLP